MKLANRTRCFKSINLNILIRHGYTVLVKDVCDSASMLKIMFDCINLRRPSVRVLR